MMRWLAWQFYRLAGWLFVRAVRWLSWEQGKVWHGRPE